MTQRDELRTLVRTIAKVETHDISDANLDIFLNEGYSEVLSNSVWPWAYIIAPETITCVADQVEYTVSSAVKRITSVINVDEKYPMRMVSISEWANVQNTVTGGTHPTHWTMANRKLQVWPPPGGTDEIDIYFYGDPGFGSLDADVPPFDAAFHEMLANWALSRLWEAEEDMQKADDYRTRFELKLLRMRKFYNEELTQRPEIFGGGNLSPKMSNMSFLSDAASGGAT